MTSADCEFDDHPPITGSTACAWCDPPPDWLDEAACRFESSDLFFSGMPALVKKAKTVCASCTVRPYCLERGWDEEYGLWGGMTEEQRQQLRDTLGLDKTTRRQRRLTIRTIGSRPIK